VFAAPASVAGREGGRDRGKEGGRRTKPIRIVEDGEGGREERKAGSPQ